MLRCFNLELSQNKLFLPDHLDIVHKKEQEENAALTPRVFLKPQGISEFCRVPSPTRAAYLSLCGAG